ncbi:unnamed protein product [Lupinus luteus]|uniref:Uncharacterized protein n=1 Tax=Lupinus luteus TaxID=3873 RepID=A0AAV1WAJ5_LUPLU
MTDSPERVGEIERTSAKGFEKRFFGRPDDFSTNSMRTSVDENITSIHTFVVGVKEMVKLEYGKQLVDGQVGINHLNCILLHS